MNNETRFRGKFMWQSFRLHLGHLIASGSLIVLAWGFSVSVVAQRWEELPLEFDYPPYGLHADSSGLLIFGNFRHVNGVAVDGLIAYDGNGWDSLGSGFSMDPVTCMQLMGGRLYVGGGGVSNWDGQVWEKVTSDGSIWSLYDYGGQLLAGGLFDVLGNDSLSSLAAWDGQSWHEFLGTQSLFKGNNNSIRAMCEYQGELYLAGNIDYLGSMKEIMRWDGQAWTDVGGGIGGGGSVWVNDLMVYEDELYVAGRFYEWEGCPGNNIAKWNGSEWQALGEGVGPGQAFDLFVMDGKLYVSGQFYTAGGLPADFIAHWDGQQWCSFGGVIDNAITRMSVFEDDLYVAGGFWTMDGDSIRGIARWRGGNQVDSCIYAALSVLEPHFEGIFLYPNPAGENFLLSLPNGWGSVGLGVVDIAGRVVLPEQVWRMGDAPVDVSMLPAGVYVVEVRPSTGLRPAQPISSGTMRGKVEYIKLIKH